VTKLEQLIIILDFNACILCARLFNHLLIFISLDSVTQGRIANNFIIVFMVILILNDGVIKTNVALKLLSFGANNVFVFQVKVFFLFIVYHHHHHVFFTIIVN
jgi:hypothetical protein